jgi:long-chain fatty acid transport protein
MNIKTRTLVLALAAAFPLAAQATDGYFSHGYGMQAKGMGGASTAMAESAFGAATNPATMAFVGNRWELGVDLFSPRRKASRTGGAPYGLDGSADSDSNLFAVPELAYNRMMSPTWSLGLTVYGNGGMNTDYPGGQLPSPGACGPATGPGTGFNPQPGPYNLLCGNGSLGVDLSQLIVAPSAAFKLGPDHAIGIAPLFAYQRFRIEGIQPFEGFSTSPGSVTNNGYDDSTGWGVRVGYYGRITPQIAIGAAYASKMSMGEFDKYKGLFAEQGGFDIPSHYSVAITYLPSPDTLVTAEYQRINYSDAKSVGNPSRLLLQCAGGSVSNCLGGSDGAGFGWRDINVFKLGVQWQQSSTLTLRAGYNLSDNPIRAEDVTMNILAPGVVRHHLTAGATWKLDNDSAVTGAFMYAFNNDVNGPSLLNNFVPGLQAQEKIEMYQYSIGVQYSRRF